MNGNGSIDVALTCLDSRAHTFALRNETLLHFLPRRGV